MAINKKTIPKFKNEDEERAFWATHDSTEYIDWKSARRAVMPELKPSLKTNKRRGRPPKSPQLELF